MPNPVGTADQREELRQAMKSGPVQVEGLTEELVFDGLDIAEEMAEILRGFHPQVQPTHWRKALAKWDSWQGDSGA